MKKLLLFTLLLFALCLGAEAQIRHVKGISAIEVGAFKSKYGQAGTFGYSRYFSRNLYGKLNVMHEIGQDKGYKFSATGLDVTAAYTMFTMREFIFVNAIGGATVSYDQLLGEESLSPSSAIKYGILYGIETEIFISDKFALLLNGNSRYLLVDAFGKVRYYAGAGIKFNL
jgi:hypothetical protein